jgi:GTPase-associated protein 1, N-terminal domain type 1
MASRVEQVVFGYRDGHELLASSTDIGARAARELLPHLDGSFEDDTPHYLVGTSVPSIGCYLLARIWPAPEAPRPGAVWAHGLLLDNATLNSGISPWLPLLRRPSFETLAAYEQPASSSVTEKATQLVPELLVGLTWAALGAPHQQPVVLWDPVQDAEPALLALIDALPADVRPGLTFRTRARARLGASRYELQVARGILGRSGQADSPVLDLRRAADRRPPKWALLATSTPDGSRAREFLTSYAAPDTYTREHVAALMMVWTGLMEQAGPQAVLASLTGAFPGPDTVSGLRVALLGDARRHHELWELPEQDRLAALLAHSASFDWDRLDGRTRLSTLWSDRPEKAIQLTMQAFDAEDTIAAGEVFDVLVDNINLETVELLTDHPETMAQLVLRRPDLLASPTVWRALPADRAVEILEDMPAPVSIADVARALAASERPELLAAAAGSPSVSLTDLVRGVLRLKNPRRQLVPLIEASGEQLTWLLINGKLSPKDRMSLLTALPEDLLAERPIREYMTLADNVHDSKTPTAISAGVMLLTLALRSKDRTAADEVLRAVFAPVHRSLARDRIPGESWKRLDEVLPDRDVHDGSTRARQMLITRAREGHWNTQQITYALQGAGNDAAALSSMVPRKHPLRKAIDAALEGIVDLMR